MSNYAYVAVNPQGAETRGTLDVADQAEAIRRIKQMGLFPTKLLQERERKAQSGPRRVKPKAGIGQIVVTLPGFAGVPARALCVFTRQLATLIEAGMPLLRGLRTLEEQQEHHRLKQIIGELSLTIENGGTLAEAVSAHPKVFNRLYVNMVKAGEIGGALEVTLRRLAEFMEKAQKIRGKVKAAMFYPCAVLTIALAILILLMVFVVPRFKAVFDGLLNGAAMPRFTTVVFNASSAIQHHFLLGFGILAAICVLISLGLRTTVGRGFFDRAKLRLPVIGPLFRKVAISRFTRTLGTLIGSGVPILQALTIVKETTGNTLYARLVSRIHDNVKEGEAIAPRMKASTLFPTMVSGMVDVGEQTGALPEMLMKVADTYDDEVDTAAGALTSLLEPVMIVLLALIVGSIVIAIFLPIINIDPSGPHDAEGPSL
jgi:type IV pilus assembly protein PilC